MHVFYEKIGNVRSENKNSYYRYCICLDRFVSFESEDLCQRPPILRKYSFEWKMNLFWNIYRKNESYTYVLFANFHTFHLSKVFSIEWIIQICSQHPFSVFDTPTPPTEPTISTKTPIARCTYQTGWSNQSSCASNSNVPNFHIQICFCL